MYHFNRYSYNFYTDPSHGWLEVPIELLQELNISNKISRCSYIDHTETNVYLEEDCDAPVLLKAFKEKYNESLEFDEVHTNDESFVRELPSYYEV